MFQKEEDPVITVKNVVGGDINDSSTHYQVHKEAATAAGITIGVIAVLSIMGCLFVCLFLFWAIILIHTHIYIIIIAPLVNGTIKATRPLGGLCLME